MRLLPLLFVSLLACNPSGQEPPGASLIRVDTEAAGANCETGGVSIRAGLDADHNGSLSLNEVESIHYVCNGATGASAAALKLAAENAVLRAMQEVSLGEAGNFPGAWADLDDALNKEKVGVTEEGEAKYADLMKQAHEAFAREEVDEYRGLALRAYRIKKDPEAALLLAIAACHDKDLAQVFGLKGLLGPQLFRKLKNACEESGFPLPEHGKNPCAKNPSLPECMLQ